MKLQEFEMLTLLRALPQFLWQRGRPENFQAELNIRLLEIPIFSGTGSPLAAGPEILRQCSNVFSPFNDRPFSEATM
jgi:hypothetical protein